MRNAFINSLAKKAKKDNNIILISGDLGYGVLKEFYDDIPDQFIDAGICEQNMTSIAAGLALEGKKTYTYSIANFSSLRCIEQIRNDILYHHANVKIISVGSGLGYGSLGMSHHGTEDLGIMRCLPNLIIFSPCDKIEASKIADITTEITDPCYIRLGKVGEENINKEDIAIVIGKANQIISGNEVVIFVTGSLGYEAFKAAKELNNMNISTSLYSFPTIKPIDEDLIKDCANKYKLIITVEENNIIGGLFSAVAEIISQDKYTSVLRPIGLKDTYVEIVGNQNYLREVYSINKDSIINEVLKYRKNNK